MSDRPDAVELLGIARSSLLEHVLFAVPEELRYEVRMIANALSIVERELASGGRADAILPDTGPYAAQIRAGEFDSMGPARAAIEAQLRAWVRARLAISNPKRLEEKRR